MALDMFQARTDGFSMPHPKVAVGVQLIVEAAIRAAWELLTNHGRSHFDLATAVEDEVTHELHERIVNEVFDRHVVEGFDRSVFASIHRDPKIRNFDGQIPDKMPDLIVDFVDRPAGVMYSQFALFIECKPVDQHHSVLSAYCDRGLVRFIRGDYAWAMQDAMMLAYARPNYSAFPRLPNALDKSALVYDPPIDYCPHSPSTSVADRVVVSRHPRRFIYADTNQPPTPITVRHLWLRRPAELPLTKADDKQTAS